MAVTVRLPGSLRDAVGGETKIQASAGTLADVFADIHRWWQANQAAGRASLLLGYSLGKSQRLLGGLDSSVGPIFTHGSVERFNAAYRAAGVLLPDARPVSGLSGAQDWSRALVLALVETFSILFVPAGYQAAISFALLVVVLLVVPGGIAGVLKKKWRLA